MPACRMPVPVDGCRRTPDVRRPESDGRRSALGVTRYTLLSSNALPVVSEPIPLYVAYHDEEWGVPVHDDRQLFELLILEGAQAGLSWITVLRKREAYRQAFHGFDIDRVASYGDEDVTRLLADPGIVRNRLKVRGAIRTAKAVPGDSGPGRIPRRRSCGTSSAVRHVSIDGPRCERCPPPRQRRRR